jgi:hypothetical protein
MRKNERARRRVGGRRKKSGRWIKRQTEKPVTGSSCKILQIRRLGICMMLLDSNHNRFFSYKIQKRSVAKRYHVCIQF